MRYRLRKRARVISRKSGGLSVTRVRERVLVSADFPAARLVSVLMLLCIACWMTLLVVRAHLDRGHGAPGRFGWSLALLAAMALIARGIFLGRPVTTGHAMTAAAVVCAGLGARFLSFGMPGNILIAVSGLALMLPTSARPQPEMLERVWPLVNATRGDPLAPFAMHSSKSYHFNTDETAAIAYRTRLGFAVVSGDPIGDVTQFDNLVVDFARMCRSRGWRIIVLACGERHSGLWRADRV